MDSTSRQMIEDAMESLATFEADRLAHYLLGYLASQVDPSIVREGIDAFMSSHKPAPAE